MKRFGYKPPRADSTRRNRALAPLVAILVLAAGCAAPKFSSHDLDTGVRTATPAAALRPRSLASSVAGTDRTTARRGTAGRVERTSPPSAASAPNATTVVPKAEIYSVRATPNVVHGGDHVRWDVRTTPDIVSVAAHVSAVTLPLNRLSTGHFGLNFAVPNGVPFFFHGVYDLDVRALSASGEIVHRGIELSFE